MENIIKNRALKLFFIIVVILTIIVDVLIFALKEDILYLVLMWLPAIAAIIANIYESIKSNSKFSIIKFFNEIGFKLCNVKYILIGIILPLVYLLIPYMIYWKMYPDNFAYSGVAIKLIIADCAPAMFIGIISSLISALGEEIGWRGYMVPRLKEKYGLKKALIISSLFWCLWHFPLIISGLYLFDIPLYYQLPFFILGIFPVGVICGLLALKTSSVWPSAFLHAAHNNYDQSVLQIITRGDSMFYFVSETGIFTIIVTWIIMIIMYLLNKNKLNNN